MTYYSASQFKERWYIRFKDFKDGDWRISIEDPTFSGTATELTGAENPFEWMGQRDEDQTACVCGSTGYVRIVVTDEADIAGIRPTQLNNRRVTATRNNTLVWQGFLKQEEYSQDWISAPYEVELPILSPLELAKDMPLPPYTTTSALSQKRFIHLLIPYMVQLLGVDITHLVSNYQAHIRLNGYPHDVQWIYGKCNIEHFYEFGETSITPKTVYDVLETIFYPWGRLTEMGSKWYAITFDQTYKRLYQFDMNEPENYMVQTSDTYTEMDMSALEICSTDNTKSYIAAPKSVTFKTGVSSSTSIVNLSEKMIGESYNPSIDNLNSGRTSRDNNTKWRWLVGANAKYCEQLTMDGGSWVRVMGREDESNSDGSYKYTHSMPVKLGIRVGTSDCEIITKQRLQANGDYNVIKISIAVFDANGWEIDDDDTNLQVDGYAIKKNYFRNSNTFTRHIGMNTSGNNVSTLTLKFKSTSGNYIIVPTIEYIKTETNNQTATVNRFHEGIFQREYHTAGNGLGKELSIEFKTLCGALNEAIANICVPFNGFNDSMSLADMQPRWKLELSEVRTADPLSLHLTPTLITDNTLRYIPVAVGMNARDCTTRLTLVSTNL